MSTITRIVRLSITVGLLASVLLLIACGGGDDNPGSLVLSDDSYSVLENAGALSITVNRINGSSGVVSVDYATQDGTALDGADYETALGTLTFTDGVTSQDISITIIDNDVTNVDKSFSLMLSNPTGGATLGSPSDANVTILDDERIPIYDFEDLSIGEIIGQDNWVETVANAIVVNGTLVNVTQVLQPELINGLFGDTELTRVNDGNFSYFRFTGSVGEVWFDATADDNAIFALGQDINTDGFLSTDDDEIGVPFGFWERRFAIFNANSLIVRHEADLDLTTNKVTDWYRLRLRIDFTANSGDGSASLSYMNLSNGDTRFTDVPTLQDLNIRLLQNGAPDQANWNAMFLKLRRDATNIPKVDNLIPNVPIIP